MRRHLFERLPLMPGSRIARLPVGLGLSCWDHDLSDARTAQGTSQGLGPERLKLTCHFWLGGVVSRFVLTCNWPDVSASGARMWLVPCGSAQTPPVGQGLLEGDRLGKPAGMAVRSSLQGPTSRSPIISPCAVLSHVRLL